MQCGNHDRRDDNEPKFMKLAGFEQFHASLAAAKVIPTCPVQECQWGLPMSPRGAVDQCNAQPKLLSSSVFEESIQRVESTP